jgi:alkylation response protein AidB-like acyl-CoA dehydrogenase/acyl carrier protein
MKQIPTEARNIIEWLRNYAKDRLNSRLIDERRCIPPYVVLDLGNRGILGMQIDRKYGGLGLNNVDSMRIVEQLAAIDLTLATFVVNNDFLGIRPIHNHATSELKEELLPLLATGRELAAFALTEPVAGSNPQAIATQGTIDPQGGWRLNGTKVWSGSAAWAGVVSIFAKLTDEEGKMTGISGFAVRQGTAGFRMGAESLTMGMRGMVQNFIHLEGVPVNTRDLLGNVGDGMKAARDGMLHTRLAIGAMCVGGMKRCLQLMLRYAHRRTIGTGLLLDNPVTQVRIGNLTAATTAFEALIARVSELLDAGKTVPAEAYMACKTAGPELLWQTADTLVQLLGGRGYIETNIAAQILRDARIFRVFEGPTETLMMFLGSRVLHQNEELDGFLRDCLSATDIAEKLQTIASQIQERRSLSYSPFGDSAASLRWAAMRVGEITTYALLLAALRGFNPESFQTQRAIVWAQQEFDRLCHLALNNDSSIAAFLDSDRATEVISSYHETIGDLEQTLAGEEIALDPILHKEVKERIPLKADDPLDTITEEIVTGKDAPVNPVSLSSPEAISALEVWLTDWIAKQLKTAPELIDTSKSIFYYGLDSVTAITLLADLEDLLDREFPPALVWNYPIIKDLALYLIQETDRVDTASLPQDRSAIKENGSIDLDRLSDAEVDSLLARLMAEEAK